MSKYYFSVSYDIQYYPELDDKLEKLVGRHSDGSGMGMGERDISWYLSSKKRVLEVFSRISPLKQVRDFNISKWTNYETKFT